jgi:lipopolysaccharide biosynthesis glycosyltransferase
MYTKLRA